MGKRRPDGHGGWVKDKKDAGYRERHGHDSYPSDPMPSPAAPYSPYPAPYGAPYTPPAPATAPDQTLSPAEAPATPPANPHDLSTLTQDTIELMDRAGILKAFFNSPV